MCPTESIQILNPSTCPVADCREAVDLVFVLDSSGSVQAHNFAQMKEYVTSLITQLDTDGGVVRVGLLTFSDSANIRFHLNRSVIYYNDQVSNTFLMISGESLKCSQALLM